MTEVSKPTATNRWVITENKNDLDVVIDWVQVTFHCSLETVFQKILQFSTDLFTYSTIGRFKYAGKYCFGDIQVFVPPEDNKKMGYHIYLSGRACRECEIYFTTQKRTWFDFFETCQKYGGNFTRLDVAIDDRKIYFDIANLYRKIQLGEFISRCRKYSYIDGGATSGERAGRTLNLGSRQSNVYIVFYEKNYEQASKNKVDVETIGDWNRYEIRLKGVSANECVKKLLVKQNIEYIAKSILNNHLRFLIRNKSCEDKNKWKTWKPWERFTKNTEKLKLSMHPAPPTLEKKKHWLKYFVAPTLKMIQKADDNTGENFLETIIEEASLKPEQESILFDYLKQYEHVMTQIESNKATKEDLERMGFHIIPDDLETTPFKGQ